MTQTFDDITDATTVHVDLVLRRYPILIGRNLLKAAPQILDRVINAKRFAIISDRNVLAHATELAKALEAQQRLLMQPFIVEPGEGSKSFKCLERICDHLLQAGLERNHGIIALGGGVTGDLVGFAAAIVKRGIAFVQIPTTLLAQVDSSVGGKTGINTRHGKNLIGAFHQPALVLADLDTLSSLSERELRAGYAEIAKYGVLGNAAFFEWLELNGSRVIALDYDALSHAIKTSCEMKADIVARDEFEKGDRALLNLGHTFGHAIEAWGGYTGAILHGEAVAIGMVLAAEFSYLLGLCTKNDVERIENHLKAIGFATTFNAIQRQTGHRPNANELLHYMEQDKKVQNGEMTFILLRNIGRAFIARNIDRDQVLQFLQNNLLV